MAINYRERTKSCQMKTLCHKTLKNLVDCRVVRVARQRNFDKLPILNQNY
jgi:hypothetical protein